MQEPALVHASIVAGTRYRYAVTLHDGDCEEHLVRFALHYYARVLYELASRDRNVRQLPAAIDRISNAVLTGKVDAFAAAGIRGAVVSSVTDPIGRVDVALHACSRRDLTLEGQFDLTGIPLANSVCAVMQKVLRLVTPEATSTLLTALANINTSYAVVHHYSDPVSRDTVPSTAYLAASFV